MQSLVRGFVSQSLKMDPLEKVRRWKRSLDGYVSFRKAVLITLCCLAFILYVGPSIFSWLFLGSNRQKYHFYEEPPPSCINDKLGQLYHQDLAQFNAHIRHSPKLSPIPDGEEGDPFLEYVGNGHFGLAPPYASGASHWSDGDATDFGSEKSHDLHDASFYIRGGNQRVLRTRVNYKPVARLSVDRDFVPVRSQHTASVVSYLKGLIHTVDCNRVGASREQDFSVDNQVYAHRAIPHVLVQELKVTNPTSSDKLFNVERMGISGWEGTETKTAKIEAGDGGKQYFVVSGVVKLDDPFSGFSSSPFVRSSGLGAGSGNLRKSGRGRSDPMYSRVVVVAPVLDSTVVVGALKTHPITLITSIVHSEPLKLSDTKDPNLSRDIEKKALDSIKQAFGLTTDELRHTHRQVWKSLWTTGFGISHSMAEGAINGRQINATMYYVLSQAPTPLHSMGTSSQVKIELADSLSYSEGCYGSLPTLHETKNLWRLPDSLYSVNNVVQYWFLNLEVNGCHKLLSAGADGVVQAMVLSLVGLKFRQHHIELDANPKDLHRDYQIRRISYGNSTHLNISVFVNADNKAEIEVTLDRQNREYYACDAGCLDPPVKLSKETRRFPVKLTDPVTAVLYITSDYEHMRELKHTIHVKEVNDAPAHEHHVIELHKHGNKLGGLPMIFWVSIGSLIVIFHVFLFKMIWQEYCSGAPEKYRTRPRKYSDLK